MTIGRKLAVGLGTSLALLAAVGGISYRGTDYILDRMAARGQAIKLLQGIEDVSSTIKDAETGQRGYLLVGDEAYLAPYFAATRDVDRVVKNLQALTSDDPRQRSQLHEVELLLAEKLNE